MRRGMRGVREQGDVEAAADDVVVEREARQADRLQSRVAQPLAVVDLLAVGGLEKEAAKMDRLHQQAVARLDRMIVDVARVGEVETCRLLARDDPRLPGQGR